MSREYKELILAGFLKDGCVDVTGALKSCLVDDVNVYILSCSAVRFRGLDPGQRKRLERALGKTLLLADWRRAAGLTPCFSSTGRKLAMQLELELLLDTRNITELYSLLWYAGVL